MPEGAERRPGPVRGLIYKGSIVETLEGGIDEDLRGGLQGRYALEALECFTTELMSLARWLNTWPPARP